MAGFTSGREMSRTFYRDLVRPVLDRHFPGLAHSAALLGRGSEVQGFDDPMSGDHNWEPRVLIFLDAHDHQRQAGTLDALLGQSLPARLGDHPTQWQVVTIRSYLLQQLGVDIDDELEPTDWLTLPEQRLRMITCGAVFHDGIGLQAVLDRFAFYPRDVWLYLLMAAWWRLHPEVNLVGRTGYVGDELGSRLIGAELVRNIMQLCFLMERQYAPYAKWFGTAFSGLDCAVELSPVLQRILAAQDWASRERALMPAYRKVIDIHHTLGITPPVEPTIHRLWQRPFEVLWADLPGALRDQIEDPEVQRIAAEWPAGGAEQFRDIAWAPHRRHRIRGLVS
jgi:hypothetical protein